MPLIKNFHATNVWYAFILNSILTSIIIVVSITTKQTLDNFVYKDAVQDNKTTFGNIILTFIVTFIISMISFSLMYFIFGFGGGLLVN
jgi:uncharacterized BrkB/YihY/UPF0761 family membrane protein